MYYWTGVNSYVGKGQKRQFLSFFADKTLLLLLMMIRWQKSLLTSNEKNLLHPLLPSFIITTEIGCNLSHWKVLIKGLCILLTRESESSILILWKWKFQILMKHYRICILPKCFYSTSYNSSLELGIWIKFRLLNRAVSSFDWKSIIFW